MKLKVLLICNTDGALYVFRRPIIDRLIEDNYSVETISSKGQYFEKLKKLGVLAHELNFSRHSVSIVRNAALLVGLIKKMYRIRPDIVHSFTHKPAIYGSLAAKLLGVKHVFVTITGLGPLFVNDDVRSRLFRKLLLFQYRIALVFVDNVFFQNPDDLDYFVERGVVAPNKVVLTNGSGIDLDDFSIPSLKLRKHARADLASE